MSVPMCGWNPHWQCHSEALRNITDDAGSVVSIPMEAAYGAWWDHGISNIFDAYCERGLDWALTLDYDSMFTKAHLKQLLDTFADNPHIDALAPLQAKKVMPVNGVLHETPILRTLDESGRLPADEGPQEVEWAHFGLTLFRLDAYKRMCKSLDHYELLEPDIDAIARVFAINAQQARGMARARFLQIPDSDGGYRGDDRVNSDIYFWRRWRGAGNNIYIDPSVRIGHIEATVAGFDEDLNINHVHWVTWKHNERMKAQVAA